MRAQSVLRSKGNKVGKDVRVCLTSTVACSLPPLHPVFDSIQYASPASTQFQELETGKTEFCVLLGKAYAVVPYAVVPYAVVLDCICIIMDVSQAFSSQLWRKIRSGQWS